MSTFSTFSVSLLGYRTYGRIRVGTKLKAKPSKFTATFFQFSRLTKDPVHVDQVGWVLRRMQPLNLDTIWILLSCRSNLNLANPCIFSSNHWQMNTHIQTRAKPLLTLHDEKSSVLKKHSQIVWSGFDQTLNTPTRPTTQDIFSVKHASFLAPVTAWWKAWLIYIRRERSAGLN